MVIYTDLEVDESLQTGKYSVFNRYFVRGAKCVLSENLCTSLGFAKGKQGVLEGLVWEEENGETPDISKMKRGHITTVRQPRYILIKVDDEIIPIGYSNGRLKTRLRKTSKWINYRVHAIDLLFAVTYHKLQGVTLDKLILSINKHPNPRLRLIMSSLYVGVTRVHKLDELRVLPKKSEDVEYLVGLKWDTLLHDWLNNYTSEGRWRHDGFNEFEEKMMKHNKMELALINDLSQLHLIECRDFVTKLDIATAGSRLRELQMAL